MVEIKKILFPLDFATVSEKVFPYVQYMVSKLEAQLYLLFVVEDLSRYANFYIPHPTLVNLEEELLEVSQEKMDNFIDKHFQDFSKVKGLVKKGDIVEEILKTVEEEDIDLIIMATHARKGLEKILLGSVAERIIKNATCPVMTINPYKVEIP